VSLVLLYSFGSQRRVRCIHHTLRVSSNIDDVLAAIGDEAMFFGIVRASLAQRDLDPRSRLEKVVHKIKPLIQAGKE